MQSDVVPVQNVERHSYVGTVIRQFVNNLRGAADIEMHNNAWMLARELGNQVGHECLYSRFHQCDTHGPMP
ncbi:hypothetical protein PSO31014_02612 [Pandoraea soli]|uniref:Uncharacterized protein n=1 Tax=Pandoraea soli TaxID=2508293 RepID=A0ABY6W0C5_9BURK|nr:hypothetical protein PSO31014_02612 [Pandoraea soli]